MVWKIYARLALIVALLYMLYDIGMPPQYVAFLGALSVAMIFLRGKIYQKIEGVIGAKFPKYHALPGWAKKAIIIIIFMAFYIAIKQVVYAALAMAGFDVQAEIEQSFASYGK